jgi:hypothetical protein
MKWLLTMLACIGIGLSIFHVRLAFPGFMAGPYPVFRDEAAGDAERNLILSATSGQTNILVSGQDASTVLSRLSEYRRKERFLEKSMLVSSVIVLGLSATLLVLIRRHL